ncbi:MAG: hypothetical protein WA945_05735, partial [Arcobacteraceae bacterium]
MSFQLLEFQYNNNDGILKNNVLDKDITFTIIIGPNGTGKSHFLSQLIEVFRDLEDQQKKNKSNPKSSKYYYIKYNINNIEYSIEKKLGQYSLSVLDWNKLKIPNTILALSFMVEDKFTYQSNSDNNNSLYKYLGIRNTANAVF